MVDHEALVEMLGRLRLTVIRDQLDSLLDEAARREMTLREALALICQREVAHRNERRVEMAVKIAHFPFVRELQGFDGTVKLMLVTAKKRRSSSALRAHAAASAPVISAQIAKLWARATRYWVAVT